MGTVVPLLIPNIFMTLARSDLLHFRPAPLVLIIARWGLAFFEYRFQRLPIAKAPAPSQPSSRSSRK